MLVNQTDAATLMVCSKETQMASNWVFHSASRMVEMRDALMAVSLVGSTDRYLVEMKGSQTASSLVETRAASWDLMKAGY